ncbi:MAG: aldo/keto reductase [Clostridiales bacterium]|jgi:predicted aldo/keto reductase-like oxidoreductase|nr:aldo/keto reductase [Clostridiales bacterium]
MIKKTFQDKRLSLLGFGTMRLPLSGTEKNVRIDEAVVNEMVRYAYEHGVNYYDTAYPYHEGESERVIGRVLKQFPRETYYLATKYPGHQILSSYNPSEIFEEQLVKCGVDYFDFYLLHNVYENSIHTYTDSRWGIVDYFLKQKKKGRIRHLGFSSHGGPENLRQFLDLYGDVMEFCQIQLNYLDWSLQDAAIKYNLLTERNIPIWVMEPVRGGRLAALSQEDEKNLKALRSEESVAAWAFRWLQALPNVKMVLSGMSNMKQMVDNIKTFTVENPLSESETELIYEIASGMKNSLPCTSCRYCCSECPQGLDIPMLLNIYNQLRFSPNINIGMRVDAIPAEKRPAACIACGACSKLCPQNIDIPAAMQEFTGALSKMPSWAEICRMREEAAQKTV